jgi:hypothetical protein
MTDAVVLLRRFFFLHMIRISSGYQFRCVHYVQCFNLHWIQISAGFRCAQNSILGKSLFVILPHRSWTQDFVLEGKRSKIYPELTTLTQNNAALTRAPREQGELSSNSQVDSRSDV